MPISNCTKLLIEILNIPQNSIILYGKRECILYIGVYRANLKVSSVSYPLAWGSFDF
jgi:hypothetical protein